MGALADQLGVIVRSDAWDVPINSPIKHSMVQLGNAMRAVMNQLNSGWTGSAAVNAREIFAALESDFHAVEEAAARIQSAIDRANRAKDLARVQYSQLPSGRVENWGADLMRGAKGNEVLSVMARPGIDIVDMLDAQAAREREEAAARVLVTLSNSLREEAIQIQKALPSDIDGMHAPDPVPVPAPISERDIYPSYGNGGADVGGPGAGGETPRGSFDGDTRGSDGVVGEPYPNPWWKHSTSVDSDAAGVLPGLGVGAVGGAALAGGARLGAGGLGGLGAAGGVGGVGGLGAGGGLAGSGMQGGSGAGSGAGAGGAAGAGMGGRAGNTPTGMMGGQGGAGGKEKRRGLGGPIAPKLEDEEEMGPRSAAAGAGGRDAEGGD